jgi:hypothetical protein
MTTLFYPALALQIQRSSSSRSQSSSRGPNPHPIRPKENPLSLLSTPLLDSFFPYPEPPFPLIQPSYFWDEMGTQDDSQAMWNVDDLGRRGRRLSQSIRPGLGREQLIAAGVAWTDVKEILTSSRVFRGDGTLDSSGNGTSAALARVIQDRLGRIISSWDSTGVIQCVKQETTGACFENKEEKVPTLVTYFRTPKGDNRIEQLERQWTEAVAEVGKDLGGILLDTKKFGDIDGVSRTLLVKVVLFISMSISSLALIQPSILFSLDLILRVIRTLVGSIKHRKKSHGRSSSSTPSSSSISSSCFLERPTFIPGSV